MLDVRRGRKPGMARLALFSVVLAWGCSRATWEPCNDLALPSDAKVVQHEVLPAGLLDKSAVFCIRFDSERAIDAVVSAYSLVRCTPGSQEPTSFVSLRPPSWWKAADTDEKFARTDQEREQYWSLWVNRKSRLLFVEVGCW